MTRPAISLTTTAALAASLLTPLLVAPTAEAAVAVPTYAVSTVIPGAVAPVDANDTGIVVGAQAVPGTLDHTPWISTGGGAWAPLPLPAGATTARPVAVNDHGVIAGNSTVAGQPRAIRWLPGPSGYAVELLPWLSVYGRGSAATGINDLGQIVGARAGLFGGVDAFGWVYSDAGGLVDLYATTGRDLIPVDINMLGIALTGAGTYDTTTGAFVPAPATPAGYQGVGGAAINDAGQFSGDGPSTSQSLPSQGVFRGSAGTGWTRLDSARWADAGDINVFGDVAYGVEAFSGAGMSAMLHLDGVGSFALTDLLTPAARAAGWIVTGSLAQLTDNRDVVVTGRNTLTGASGTLVLTLSGQVLPVPAAPTGLTATAHPATAAEKWVSIELAWMGGDPATSRYELQRAPAGSGAFTTIAQPTATRFSDTTVALATAYDYRVRAIGLGGASDWSAAATATAPSVPLDTTAPTVTLSGPADGSTVSGIVTLTANATDDVAVTRLRITQTDPVTGLATELGTTAGGGPLTVTWNTAGASVGMHAIQAHASDALGNASTALLWLQVTTPTTTARVGTISLRSSERRGVVTVTGVVSVTTLAGAGVPRATVTVTWERPDGSTQNLSAVTDSRGRATVTTSGGRGRYTLTVTGVTKSGYTFDPGAGPRSASITA